MGACLNFVQHYLRRFLSLSGKINRIMFLLGIWELLYNSNFKSLEFEGFKADNL